MKPPPRGHTSIFQHAILLKKSLSQGRSPSQRYAWSLALALENSQHTKPTKNASNRFLKEMVILTSKSPCSRVGYPNKHFNFGRIVPKLKQKM